MQSIGWHDLATATQGRLDPPRAWGRSSRISTDSRDIQPGDIFWALPGERYDGHDFAADAVAKGAALVVCAGDRCAGLNAPRLSVNDPLAAFGRLAHWHRKRHEALVIGVTGSVGKTTTKELIHSALSVQYQGLKSPGNFNNLVGLPKGLLELTLDHEFLVCEMGASREGDIRALAEIAAPEIGVITAIGPAHLASFGSLEAILRGKGELFAALPDTGFAVLPGDVPYASQLAAMANCRVIRVGTEPQNELRACDVVATASEVSFTVDGERFIVAVPGPGLLTNALSAIAIGREIGIPLEALSAGLEDFRPLPGRGAVRQIGGWHVIDDCYNASPLAVAAACQRLAMYHTERPGRKFAVLGDMRELGSTAAAEHREIGRLLASLPLDGVLAYGEHARSIAEGALRGGWTAGRIVATESLDVLQLVLECWLAPGDALLIKGSRAMQMERVIDWLVDYAARAPLPELRQCA